MPFDIEMNPISPSVNVIFSKTVEVIACVQLLAQPSHHENVKEISDDIDKYLSNESKKTLEDIGRFRFHGLELFDLILDLNELDDVPLLAKEINNYTDIKFLSIFTFSQKMLDEETFNKVIHQELSDEELEKVFPWAFCKTIDEIKFVLFNPNEFKKRLSNLIIDIYETPYFESYVDSIFFRYKDIIKKLEDELKRKTPQEVGEEIMKKTFDTEYDVGTKNYIFCPSYFASPHRLRLLNETTNFIIFDLDQSVFTLNKDSETIVNTMKVLSDSTRLEILKHLNNRPTYGKVLANSLNLTTSTISHHLELLKSIGLVIEDKVKNIKYFSVDSNEIERRLQLIKDYILNK